MSLVSCPCRYSAASGPLNEELAAPGAIEQPALLAQLPVLGVELDCRRVGHPSDSRNVRPPGCLDSRNLFSMNHKLMLDALVEIPKPRRSRTTRRRSTPSRAAPGPVLNGEVAERLGVTPATATSMLKRLDEPRPGRVPALQGRDPDPGRREGRARGDPPPPPDRGLPLRGAGDARATGSTRRPRCSSTTSPRSSSC